MISPVQYLKEVGQELQRVSWPTARMTAMHTAIVIISMIVIIALVGGIDSLLVALIRKGILKG